MKSLFYTVSFLLMLILGCSVPNWRMDHGIIKNTKTILTSDGNLWEYDSELPAGREISVWFNCCDTPDKEDDIIFLIY